MLRVHELNCPATPTTITVAGTGITATTLFYHQDGNIVGPTGALTYDLTGIKIADNTVAFLTLYVRAIFDKLANTTTFVTEVEKTGEGLVNLTGTVYNQDFAGGVASATTKSVPVAKLFQANHAYLAGDLIREGTETYKVIANFTSGVSFDPSTVVFVTTPDATPRAILGFVMVANEGGAEFIGGTTSLAGAGITSTVLSETVYNIQ